MCTPRKGSILFLFLSLALIGPLSAQEETDNRDALASYILEKYGPDQELYSGHQFYNAYYQYKGDPYYPRDIFMPGTLVYNGIIYQNISLKYDCFSQLVVLEFSDSKGRYNQLNLNSDNIDSFTLGKRVFRLLSLADREAAFYEVIQKEPLCCYILWRRTAVALGVSNRRYLYEFSSPSAEFYILYGEQLYSISGKKSFVSIFPESLAPGIKRYLRENRFSFKNVQAEEIENLMAFVGDQLQSQDAE